MAMRLVTAILSLPAVSATDRLILFNACPKEPIWIAHLANVGVGPGVQNVKIPPMGTHAFTDKETDGLAGARYWPKMGCDEQGNNCALGGSGGPTQHCVRNGGDYSRCAPPVDTKFEATWGRAGQPCNPAVPSEMIGCDSVDMSLVDGWTLPFKLEIQSGSCTGNKEETVNVIDCSGMTLDKCPRDENLGKGPISMVAISPHSGKPAGCYGPCLKLIDDKWNNTMARGRKRDDKDVVPYCCTFPPMTSEMCNAGPIGKTRYVQTVHQLCKGVYAFAYDDALGLMRCSYGQYKLTFYCPDGQAGSPAAPVGAPPATPPLSTPLPPATPPPPATTAPPAQRPPATPVPPAPPAPPATLPPVTPIPTTPAAPPPPATPVPPAAPPPAVQRWQQQPGQSREDRWRPASWTVLSAVALPALAVVGVLAQRRNVREQGPLPAEQVSMLAEEPPAA